MLHKCFKLTRKIKIIFFFLFTILFLTIKTISAQTDTNIYLTPIPDDLSFDEKFEALINEITDSALNYLFFADDSLAEFFSVTPMFEEWDTNGLFHNKANFSNKNDTTVIVLCYDSQYGYVQPVTSERITSNFGWRKRRYHYGIDIGLNIGDTVRSAFDGIVRIAQYHKGYGNIIVIRHFNGLESTYAHLNKILVLPNQTVHAGNSIGLGGSTGRSTGPHLHFELRYKGVAFNPTDAIDFEKHKLVSDTLVLTAANFNYLKYRTPHPINPGTATKTSNNQKNKGVYAKTVHTIKKGDTLGSIAIKYNTTVKRLCYLNGIKSTTTLQIGNKLIIN